MTIMILAIYEFYLNVDINEYFVDGYVEEYRPLVEGFEGKEMTAAEFDEAFIKWHARTVTFLVMMFGEMVNAFNCRSEYSSLVKIGIFTNKPMLYAVGLSCILTIVLYIPGSPLGVIFYVVPLEPAEWIWILPTILIVFGSVELLKVYFRKQLNLN